jgi:ubiquinone/menaquinone biosynthesis C-methylase UbiE
VPLIFEPYATEIAARARRLAPRNLLEIAAGTGAVTRALAAALPATTRMTVTDLNPPMLEQARLRLPDSRIEWQQADALALPFADASFDVVVCQFGAMFFPDKVQGYAQARRVLRGGGRYLFNVWDTIAQNDFADVAMQALAEHFPHDPPRFMARTPHGYHDADKIRAEVAAAGFSDIVIETVVHRSRAASARDVAIAYCQGTPWRGEIEARDASGLAEATARVADAIARRFGSGAVDGKISALVISATA